MKGAATVEGLQAEGYKEVPVGVVLPGVDLAGLGQIVMVSPSRYTVVIRRADGKGDDTMEFYAGEKLWVK